jgi:O-methyltransferase
MSYQVAQPRAELPPPETVPRWRAQLALGVQRAPNVWRAYQFGQALLALRPVDRPYLADLLGTMLRVAPYTDGGPRLVALYRLARAVVQAGTLGDIVECGVARGGTAALLGWATRDTDRQLWLYDTFAGLPPAETVDGPAAAAYTGSYRGTRDQVGSLLRRAGIPAARSHLVPGLFEDTLAHAQVERIALLHIDGDWYRSVRTCLETLYDRVSPGGYIVLDDYGYWPGCQIATDEFLAARGLRIRLERVDGARRFFRKPFV